MKILLTGRAASAFPPRLRAAFASFALLGGLAISTAVSAQSSSYPVVDTGQTVTFDDAGEIAPPAEGEAFYGQDAQFNGNQPRYLDNGDGTVSDLVTGLMWSKSPDLNGDGLINAQDKRTYQEALSGAQTFRLAGYDDWRLPSIKALYSLIDFRGTDPSGDVNATDLTPFIDTAYFDFGYGDTSAGDRVIDAQFASSTQYVSTTMNGADTMFGVNFADGRIKGYPTGASPNYPQGKGFYVYYVRGNGLYGQNDFADNGDGTITDRATGLMWSKADSGVGMDWQSALAWVQAKNAENDLGHDDWRLPNAKELQSIVDYTRSPDTTGSAAIDARFDATAFINEGGQADFGWYWTGTTHAATDGTGRAAVYVAFGRALGWMAPEGAPCLNLLDVHGAGAQRSDPKSGSPSDYYLGESCGGGPAYGRGPQGDVIRVDNLVRLVRNASAAAEPLSVSFAVSPRNPTDAAPVTLAASASGGTAPYTFEWTVDGLVYAGSSVTLNLAAGSHPVSLSVTDSAGSEATANGVLAVAPSVVISTVVKKSKPFRLIVSGAGFEPGCFVKIDALAVPKTVYAGEDLVKAKGGGALKAMMPKGATVQVTVVNPDGSASAPFPFAR